MHTDPLTLQAPRHDPWPSERISHGIQSAVMLLRLSVWPLLVLVSLIPLLPAIAYPADPAVLILHSYHQEDPWTTGQNDGSVQALQNAPALQGRSFYTEHFDTKRVLFNNRSQEFFPRYLAEQNISVSQLPEGGSLLERPQAVFFLYQKKILLILFFFVLQTAIIILLVRNIARRRQAERNLLLANEKLEIRVAERTADQQQANARLREEVLHRTQAEERLSTVVRNLPIVLWAIDSAGLFTLSTGKGLAKLNLSEGQLVGQSLFDIYAGNQAIVEAARKALNGESFSTVLEEGGVIFESHYSPLFTNGDISGVIGIAIDVTERSSLEKQIRQAQKMEAIGTLAGGIAHDFNNILGAIIGYAELGMLDARNGEAVLDYFEEIRRASDRARELVAHILTFSRQTEMHRQPLNVAPIVKEALKLLRASLPANIEIRSEVDTEAGKIKADPVQVHQCLMNLCTNAAHAMRESGGVLEVAVGAVLLGHEAKPTPENLPPGRYLAIMVRDTGCGMDEVTLARIFEPFFSTKERGEGTGMGLSVVHGIMKSHGGGVEVESRMGQGTTFRLYFPLLAPAAENSAASIVVSSPPAGGNERILLVDDEPQLMELGQRILEYLGYVVTAKASSVAALELFEEQAAAFDLVITDQTMPTMTGIEMAKRMLVIRPGVPIILCTGFSETVSEEQAKAIGISGYVLKPLTINDLATACREVLAAGPT